MEPEEHDLWQTSQHISAPDHQLPGQAQDHTEAAPTQAPSVHWPEWFGFDGCSAADLDASLLGLPSLSSDLDASSELNFLPSAAETSQQSFFSASTVHFGSEVFGDTTDTFPDIGYQHDTFPYEQRQYIPDVPEELQERYDPLLSRNISHTEHEGR